MLTMLQTKNLKAEFEAYLQGSMPAFERMYDAVAGKLHSYLTSMLLDPVKAEDILQSLFSRMIQQPEPFQSAANFEPYLFRTARNMALDWIRRYDSRHRQVQ